jgi:hypothetical protein
LFIPVMARRQQSVRNAVPTPSCVVFDVIKRKSWCYYK